MTEGRFSPAEVYVGTRSREDANTNAGSCCTACTRGAFPSWCQSWPSSSTTRTSCQITRDPCSAFRAVGSKVSRCPTLVHTRPDKRYLMNRVAQICLSRGWDGAAYRTCRFSWIFRFFMQLKRNFLARHGWSYKRSRSRKICSRGSLAYWGASIEAQT